MEAKKDTTWVVKMEAKCGSKMEVKLLNLKPYLKQIPTLNLKQIPTLKGSKPWN